MRAASYVKGIVAAILFALNTALWCVLLYGLIAFKIIVPHAGFRRRCTDAMTWVGENWISINSLGIETLHRVRWNIQGTDDLKRDRSYLVCANHQSWVDIVVLQRVLNRRIPFLRFFLKQELIWTPLLGLAWWGLDFPFMKRYSKEYLAAHPEKRGEDLAATRRACERFRGSRVSVLNFLEGTRFTKKKHAKQNSPYEHLLVPKTGGIAFVLDAMGDQFEALLDVTIHYEGGAVSLWDLLCGNLDEVTVHVEKIAIPSEFLTRRYFEDEDFRARIQTWLRGIWERKDQRLSQLNAGR